MEIAVFGNNYQSSYASQLRDFLSKLAATPSIRLKIEKSFSDYLSGIIGRIDGMETFEITAGFDADLVLSIGGDGTFLHTAALIAPKEIPMMGINTGHLGYLAATRLDQTPHLINDIVEKNYLIEDRAMLTVEANKTLPSKLSITAALNEIVVQRTDLSNLIEVSAFIDGCHMTSYLGDGLIIATPTGSTAYNLSAGGPILAPNAPSWVMTPMAPHSLNIRPIVVDYNTEIRLTIKSRGQRFTLSVDGHSVVLTTDTELRIGRAPYVTRLVRLINQTFIDTLREKLLWGISPR